MPGGVGTMDELFEALTLIQTGKIKHFPIDLMGRQYWEQLIALLQQMAAAKTIDPAHLDLLLITNSVQEAMAHIKEHAIEKFGLHHRKSAMKRTWLLRE